MKVLIVEDSAIVRGRIIAMISGISGVEIVGVSGNPGGAAILMEKHSPDLVILDIRLYGGSGIDLLQRIKEERPETVVMMLTNYPYPQYMKRCMELGADYFFDKSRDFDKILDVLSERVS